jgi:glutamyl-tRNA synthetase
VRLVTDHSSVTITDALHGEYEGQVDDIVLMRADGVPAYNLTLVLDDAFQGVDQVVRGDDLLSSTPRQVYLGKLLGLQTPMYVHVPLVVNHAGKRLSKRDGAVSLEGLAGEGISAAALSEYLLASLGVSPRSGQDARSMKQVDAAEECRERLIWAAQGFSIHNIPRDALVWDAGSLQPSAQP